MPVIVVPMHDTPPNGGGAVPLRLPQETKNNVTRAANLLGMSSALFMRTVLHNAALKVIEEVGDRP